MKKMILAIIMVIMAIFTALPTLCATEAVPTITYLPVAEAIYEGESLSLSRLYFGEAKYDGVTVDGTFSWQDPSLQPAISDSNSTLYRVVFTPNDSAAYSSVELDVKINVYADRGENISSFAWVAPNPTVDVSRPDIYKTVKIGWGFREYYTNPSDPNGTWHNLKTEVRNPKDLARYVAEGLIQLPRGKRTIDAAGWIFNNFFAAVKTDYIFYDEPATDNTYYDEFGIEAGESGCSVLQTYINGLFSELSAMGIEVNNVYIDTETLGSGLWHITKQESDGNEKQVWSAIWDNPRFQSEILPQLNERGFVACTDADKYPLYYVRHYNITVSDLSPQKTDYNIWNEVMYNYTTDLLNTYIFDVIQQYYPEAKTSNYRGITSDGWYNTTIDSHRYYLGGTQKNSGNVNSPVLYADKGEEVWKASSDDYELFGTNTPFSSLLVEINEMRDSILSSTNGNVTPYICNAYYPNKLNTDGTYEEYKELLLHVALCNPGQMIFFTHTTKGHITGDTLLTDEAVLKQSSDILQAILDEVNGLVAYSDRHTLVDKLTSYNDKFVITGMYANNQNVWRITPDLSQPGVTVENFCVNAETPTFYIAGKTVTFPEGSIYTPTGTITSTYGYWVITPADVTPVVVADSDVYKKVPVYAATFESYNVGDQVQTTSPNSPPAAEPMQFWTNNNAGTVIAEEENGNKVAMVSSGMCIARSLNDVNVAGQYAKQQVWQMRVKLSQIVAEDTIGIFNYGPKGDWNGKNANSEVRIIGDKVMYKIGGVYQSIMTDGNTLSANEWYTFTRKMDFSTERLNRSSVYVTDSKGNIVAQIEDADAGTLPTNEDRYVVLTTQLINHNQNSANNPVYIDDFKIYPTGAYENFQLFVDSTGVKTTELQHTPLVGKLTYLNATGATANYEVYCEQYDESGNMISNSCIFDENINHGEDGYLLTDMPEVLGNAVAMRVYSEGEGTTFSMLYGQVITKIDVASAADSVIKGGSQPFTATVTGTDLQMNSVTWSVIGNTSSATRVNSLGVLTIGADEASEKVTVIATSAFDTAKSGRKAITVLPTVATVSAVTVTPDSATVENGGNISFEASITGENEPSQAAVWSVSGNSSAATAVDDMGKLTVSALETATSLTVTATSLVDSTKFAVATVTVQSLPELLTIQQTVTGTGAPETAEFEFTVKAAGSAYANKEYKYYAADGSEITKAAPYSTDAAGKLKLKAGETVIISGIADGTAYEVTETANADYVTTKTGNSGNMTMSGATAKFTSSYEPKEDLSVTMTVTAATESTAPENDEFELLIKVNGTAYANKAYKLYDLTTTEIPGTYETDGEGRFKLAANSKAVFENIPVGTTYEISGTAKDGYETTIEGGSGSISSTGSTAEFTNKYVSKPKPAASTVPYIPLICICVALIAIIAIICVLRLRRKKK